MEELALKIQYERFKLQWMLDHGWTLSALVASMDRYAESEGDSQTIWDTYHEWEFNSGFCGEIWPCFEEWLENEYKEQKGERK